MRTPKFLFLQTNQRCNLKCTHCMYWKNDDSDSSNYLSATRKLQLIREFASLGGESVVTCGGEPTLDRDEFFSLCQMTKLCGLKLLSVTNGTTIRTRIDADKMMLWGPSEISISLDHWSKEKNDELRGVSGAWEKATNAVRLLVEARNELSLTTPIYVMTILSNDTYDSLEAFYTLVLKVLGADKLKLNLIQPTFQGKEKDVYFTNSRIDRKNISFCMSEIERCDSLFGINRNLEWMRDVEMYLRSITNPLLGWNSGRGTTEAICNSYDRNIMVDLYGRAKLCFSPLYPAIQLTHSGDLIKYWNDWSKPIRDCMVGCKQYCGISHSVRASKATL